MTRSFSSSLGRLLVGTVLLLALTAGSTQEWRAAHAQAALVVDDDGRATVTDCDAQEKTFKTVQAAVDAAQPGTSIVICPGTYAEQVVVRKSNLTLQGSGQGITVLRPTSVPATVTGLLLPYPIAPMLLVNEATGVTVSRLTVDGSAADSGASTINCPQVGFVAGIHFRNASGTIDTVKITKVNSGTRCSDAVRGESSSTGVSNLVVKNSLIDQNGNFGVFCIGPGVTCSLTGNTVRGRGLVSDQIQAGIAVRSGATATLTGNVIRDHRYALAQGVPSFSIGIFLVYADPNANAQLLQGNTFVNNDLDVQRYASEQAL
jgi:hypothetical protein